MKPSRPERSSASSRRVSGVDGWGAEGSRNSAGGRSTDAAAEGAARVIAMPATGSGDTVQLAVARMSAAASEGLRARAGVVRERLRSA